MLVVFVALIVFGRWYIMDYESANVELRAEFSLILLYTKIHDKATGTN